MTNSLKCITLLLVLFLAACAPHTQEGSGQLPDQGAKLLADLVANERNDESGGLILYVEDANAPDLDGTVWCVHVRYVNQQGVTTAPFLVRQVADDWYIERNPNQVDYERYGCNWP